MDRTLTVSRPVAPPPPAAGSRPAAPRAATTRTGGRAAGPRTEPRRVPVRLGELPFRRVVQGILAGALVMFAVATVDAVAGATVPVLGTFAALPTGGEGPHAVVEVPAPPAAPGTCLTWSRPDAADTAVVDCGQPHLFEQAGTVPLTDQPTLPTDQQWTQLVAQRCTPVVTRYLGGKFDPDGRYRVGAMKPSAAKWREGDRELRCGLQTASQSGAYYPSTGRVEGSDQSDVEQPGTCLGINGKQVGDPVPCAGMHAVEVVGIVDVAPRFTGGFPAVADQDAFLQPACAKIASAYAGGDQVIASKNLTVYWDNLTPDSWKAGSRKVNCNLGALLPDRSGFAPVTGSVKGAVAVGNQPAPSAPPPTSPGAPASAPPGPGGAGDDTSAPATPTTTPSATPTAGPKVTPSVTVPTTLPTLPVRLDAH